MTSSSRPPRASIVIVTHGQRELTEQCLRSLQRCLGDRLSREWELVLIDNASPDDTPELLRSWSDRAVVRLLEENLNFAGGCNRGAAEARGEVLVFLNNDTEVTAGALETVVAQALEPGVAISGCRLLFPDRTLQHAGVAFLRGPALGGASMPQHVFRHADQDLAAARASYELDCVTAACMAVRADVFRAVGGFDQGYLNGLEDVDLCLRIRLSGKRIVYRGDATVIHHEGASRGKGDDLWATPARAAMMRHNDLHFTARWALHLDQDDALAATLWDAALRDQPPARSVRTADVVVQGQPSGISPAGGEARAWLTILHDAGEVVAAADHPVPNVVPRLREPTASLLHKALQRLPVAGARWLLVPAGENDQHEVGPTTTVRVGTARTAVALEKARSVWACSTQVAIALIDAGVPQRSVAVVSPPIPPASLGLGGEGVLAIFPAHDARQGRLVLDALRGLPAAIPVRLIPTVLSRNLEHQVATALPRAQLLGPCSDERRFAEIAASADAVITCDSTDRFDRRALVAASTGSAVLTCNPEGPAVDILGQSAFAEPQGLRGALLGAFSDPGDRHERAHRVAQACAPEAVLNNDAELRSPAPLTRSLVS